MLVFARVALTGSFTTAAADLGMPKSTVSRKVTELEARLKARLLNRTTRKVSLTDVGRTYYDHCARIVAEIEDAERAVTNLQEIPRGALRVTTGPNVAFLAPILNDYMKRYPEVRVEVFCTGRTVDLIEERFDVAIRAGALGDSTLIARSLGTVRWFLVGDAGVSQETRAPAIDRRLEATRLHHVRHEPQRRGVAPPERRQDRARRAARALGGQRLRSRPRRRVGWSGPRRSFPPTFAWTTSAPSGSNACCATGTHRRCPFTSSTRAPATSRPR